MQEASLQPLYFHFNRWAAHVQPALVRYNNKKLQDLTNRLMNRVKIYEMETDNWKLNALTKAKSW